MRGLRLLVTVGHQPVLDRTASNSRTIPRAGWRDSGICSFAQLAAPRNWAAHVCLF
jgi:hypothetical protein